MKNTVQAELRDFLASSNATTNPLLRARNVDLVMYFYGFGGPPLPTLEETAERFRPTEDHVKSKPLTRERVRQILKRDFRDKIGPNDVPALARLAELAETSPYWLNSVLTARIRDSGLAEDGFSPRGLLKLFADAGLGTAYGAYRPDLQPMRRRSSEETYDNHFIIDEHYLPTARALRKKARAFHRKYGLAQIDDLLASEEGDGDTEQRILLEQMLHLDHHVWTASDGDGIWYLFEDTKHAIRNVCEKVLPVVGSCAAEDVGNRVQALPERPEE